MLDKVITPESLFPEGLDGKEINGVYVRKGSIATCISNALLLEDPTATDEEKAQAWAQLEKLVPILEKAFSLSKALTWKNPKVRELIQNQVRGSY